MRDFFIFPPKENGLPCRSLSKAGSEPGLSLGLNVELPHNCEDSQGRSYMKALVAPLSWIWGFFVFVGKVFSERTPSNQFEWDDFLSRLRRDDVNNVNSFVARLGDLSQKVPLAVVAVGSTLSNRKAYYDDIDLLLLPLHEHNIGLAEKEFAKFAKEQQEVRAVAGEQSIYDVTTGWYLDFEAGTVPIHLLIRDDGGCVIQALNRVTLNKFLSEEQTNRWSGYSVQILNPFEERE